MDLCRALRRWALASSVALALVISAPWDAKAARIGLNVGGGAGAPGLHLEQEATSRTALSLTAGLNRLYSGYYLQVGGKFYINPNRIGPYTHITGTFGSGRTDQAVWQTGEVGLAVGNAWRLWGNFLINVELGYAVGDGASYAHGSYGGLFSSPPTGRYIIGWRLLFGD